MSYPINYPTPQGANIQIFYGGDATAAANITERTWFKPQGASFVWFTLIGAGGGGDGSTTGGGSGAVTNCMVPAFLIPDSLQISVGRGGPNGSNGTITRVFYLRGTGTTYTLLTANGGSSTGTGGTTSASNYFSCMGFYQSIAGQNGSTGSIAASTTTFLAGGNGTGGVANSNYGYKSTDDGSFQMQPIIVGIATSIPGASAGKAGIGCGGHRDGEGGDGFVVIITW